MKTSPYIVTTIALVLLALASPAAAQSSQSASKSPAAVELAKTMTQLPQMLNAAPACAQLANDMAVANGKKPGEKQILAFLKRCEGNTKVVADMLEEIATQVAKTANGENQPRTVLVGDGVLRYASGRRSIRSPYR